MRRKDGWVRIDEQEIVIGTNELRAYVYIHQERVEVEQFYQSSHPPFGTDQHVAPADYLSLCLDLITVITWV